MSSINGNHGINDIIEPIMNNNPFINGNNGFILPTMNNMANPFNFQFNSQQQILQQQMMQQQMMQQQMMQQNMMQQSMIQNMIDKSINEAVNKFADIIGKPINNAKLDNLIEINDKNDKKQVEPENMEIEINKKSIKSKPIKTLINPDKQDKKNIQTEDKQQGEIDKFLANIFDKSLDSTRNKEIIDKSFKSNKGNIILSINPKSNTNANFNKIKYPNELYNVEYIGLEKEYFDTKASDINEYALETHKYIYEHNNQIINAKIINGFVYGRCSSDNTVSIETQRNICFKYACENGIKLLNFGYQYDNNISGRDMKNLKYELGFWFDKIPNGSHIIIYSVDRLSRNVVKGIEFLNNAVKRNITVHFVLNEMKYSKESSATTLGNIQNLLVEAEKLSNLTSEKIRNTRKRLIEEGNDLRPAKYGFNVDKSNKIRKLVHNGDEMKVIKLIIDKYINVSANFEAYQQTENLKRSYKSIYQFIARWCARSGIKYRNNEPITEIIVHRIVKDKTYKF